MSLHLFGVRHHGPGCARALRRALDELRPDVIAMEGPADGEAALLLAGHAALKPPVAMLVYPPDEPRRGVYFPLAVFSPEWQALRWAAEQNVAVRLIDLPQSHDIAIEMSREAAASGAPEGDEIEVDEDAEQQASEPELQVRIDPVGLLAEAAGYRDRELWWEVQVERRSAVADLFTAIREAMVTLRQELPAATRERDLVREAFMRKTLRGIQKEGFERIAVVCGAWHVPALDEEALAGKRDGCRIKDDNDRLAGLPKVKTAVTWIPWTNSRLSYRSGYGAGIDSPGWYEHVWKSEDDAPTRWLTTAARLLREKDLDASSASVIESLRLAEALAAMRELRSPGLAELNDAILSILCHGDAAPMRLIRQELEIGDVLGEVPEETPSVPLAEDLAAQQKSLRLKPSTSSQTLDLDLRKETDLQRSRLLHRLSLLDIPWGQFRQSGGKASTFHEIWQIEWKPEFAVAVIEASVWGNTVESAAVGRVVSRASTARELQDLTALLQGVLLASLPEVVGPLLGRIQTMAAQSTDVRHLMDALPALARVARYGDVRGGPPKEVEHIITGLFERSVVGLGPAASALDDDAAERLLECMTHVGQSLDLLQREDLQAEWREALRRLMKTGVHALLRGWCCRVLLDQSAITADELDSLARLALSTANPPLDSANWAAGFLRGSGLVLLHQDIIWQVFDTWLSSLTAEVFTELLPLLRRAFSGFTGPERRQMGEKVKSLAHADSSAGRTKRRAAVASEDIDAARAARVLPILAHILGDDVPVDQES